LAWRTVRLSSQMFHPAPLPTQQELEALVARASKRILHFLQRRGVFSLVPAPGDGEVTVVADETMGEKDRLLAKLLAAATASMAPAGPAHKRKAIRIVLDPDDRPVAKGNLCAQARAFNLQAATHVAANDKPGRERLCRYILRPPLANDRLKIVDDSLLRLDFKKPWSDGTSSVDLAPLALIARLAALVPHPRLHLVRYSGMLAPAAPWRPLVIPPSQGAPTDAPTAPAANAQPSTRPARTGARCRYWPRALLMRLTLGLVVDTCPCCGGCMQLRALVRDPANIERFLRGVGRWSPPLGLAQARPPPYVRSVTRLKASHQAELFQ